MKANNNADLMKQVESLRKAALITINRNTIQNIVYALEEVGASPDVLKVVCDYRPGPEDITDLTKAVQNYMYSIAYVRTGQDIKKAENKKDIFDLIGKGNRYGN